MCLFIDATSHFWRWSTITLNLNYADGHHGYLYSDGPLPVGKNAVTTDAETACAPRFPTGISGYFKSCSSKNDNKNDIPTLRVWELFSLLTKVFFSNSPFSPGCCQPRMNETSSLGSSAPSVRRISQNLTPIIVQHSRDSIPWLYSAFYQPGIIVKCGHLIHFAWRPALFRLIFI